MRTEYKEITIKQEVYISDDGKEFIDEDECLDHEFKVLGQQIECYNYDCTKVDNPEDCSVVNLRTEDDFKRFVHWSDICGSTTDGIDKPGLYVYGCSDEWINVGELISKIGESERMATE